MRNPHGYYVEGFADGSKKEYDTVQCVHCQAHRHLQAGQSAAEIGGWCYNCAGYVCEAKDCIEKCTPWEKKIEQIEARGRFFRQIGLG